MENDVTIQLGPARVTEVDEILTLYRKIYGSKYPISYGTDPGVLRAAIADERDHLVMTARAVEDKVIAGLVIVEKDIDLKLGKVVGLVVHPDYQRHKIAHRLVSTVTEQVLVTEKDIHSLYATTRTVSVGPQMVFFKNGYLPLGIFPNAHRLSRFESVTLMARFREGVLERRDISLPATAASMKLFENLVHYSPEIKLPQFTPAGKPTAETDNEEWDFEIIRATEYVQRRFQEQFTSSSEYFFPFASPNIIFSDKKGRLDIYGHFSEQDGYCVLIASTKVMFDFTGHLNSLFTLCDSIGISYLEVLARTTSLAIINNLLAWQFLPSAIYPALQEVDGKPIDYIFLSRTMEPLNFRGMAIIAPFKPYIDQYVDAWRKSNLDTLQVVHGPSA